MLNLSHGSAHLARQPVSVFRMVGKVHINTFGCQMNEYDSGRMADVLRVSRGYELTDRAEDADVILLNTCSVREKVFLQLNVLH